MTLPWYLRKLVTRIIGRMPSVLLLQLLGAVIIALQFACLPVGPNEEDLWLEEFEPILSRTNQARIATDRVDIRVEECFTEPACDSVIADTKGVYQEYARTVDKALADVAKLDPPTDSIRQVQYTFRRALEIESQAIPLLVYGIEHMDAAALAQAIVLWVERDKVWLDLLNQWQGLVEKFEGD